MNSKECPLCGKPSKDGKPHKECMDYEESRGEAENQALIAGAEARGKAEDEAKWEEEHYEQH